MSELAKVLMVILAGASIPFVRAYHQSMRIGEEHDAKTDLATLLQKPPVRQHERLGEALHIIDRVQAAPRCHHNAALHLLNDCKFLEPNSADTGADADANLDQVEKVYAARLAVCELQSAHADIPVECKVVMASREACAKERVSWFSRPEKPKEDRLCYAESTDPKQFNRCLKALNSKSQSWTSYSNARQNAVIMCHASRDVIEKEKNLEHYTNLAEAVSQMTVVLAEYEEKIKLWNDELLVRIDKIRTSTEQALQDSEDNRSNLELIKSNIRSLQGVMSYMAETYSQAAEEAVAKYRNDMEQHRQEIKDHYQQHLEDIDQHHQEVRRHNHEMKIEIEQHHEGMVEHVAVQRTHLEQNMQQQQQSAIVAVQAVYQSAALQMTGLVNQMESKMETLEVKLDQGAAKMQNLTQGMSNLSQGMTSISQGLDRFNMTVSALHDAAAKLPDTLRTLTASWDTIVSAGAYILLSFLSMGCVIGMCMFSVRLARYCAVLLALAWLLHMVNVQSHASDLISTLAAGFNHLGAPFFILLGLVLVFPLSFLAHKYTRLASLVDYVDEKGRSCILPRIEAPS